MKEINKRDLVLIGAIILIVLVATIIIIIPKNNNDNNNISINETNTFKGIKLNSTVDANILQNLPIDTTPVEIINETTSNSTSENNNIVVPAPQ